MIRLWQLWLEILWSLENPQIRQTSDLSTNFGRIIIIVIRIHLGHDYPNPNTGHFHHFVFLYSRRGDRGIPWRGSTAIVSFHSGMALFHLNCIISFQLMQVWKFSHRAQTGNFKNIWSGRLSTHFFFFEPLHHHHHHFHWKIIYCGRISRNRRMTNSPFKYHCLEIVTRLVVIISDREDGHFGRSWHHFTGCIFLLVPPS